MKLPLYFIIRSPFTRDTQLKISVYDYDACRLHDDLIGSTVIDVEDRLRSKHRAYCGLAEEYSRYGIEVHNISVDDFTNTNFVLYIQLRIQYVARPIQAIANSETNLP